MASIPTQEEFLAATRKSQEAMIAAIRTWFETVRTATPKLTSVYGRLPKLPPVSLPFADKLPTPEEAVDNAYQMAEKLLANQRKFAEDLLEAMTPLMPGRSEAAPKGNGSSEPKVPGRRVWHEAVSEPKPVAVSEPKPVAVSEPKPVAVSEPEAAAAAEPEAPVRPAPKSTPARPARRTTASAAKTTTSKSSAAKSTPSTTSANRAPKGPDAS